MTNVNPTTLSLKGRLSFLARDSMVYGGAGALNKVLALFVFPILARHFSVAEYGTLDLFSSVIMMFTLFAVFGQDSAVARYYYEYSDDEDRKQVISQSLFLQFVVLVIFCPILWFYADRLSPIISDSSKSTALLKLSIAQLPFMVLINFSQNILKWTFNRVPFLCVSVGSTVVSVFSLLALVFWFSLGVEDVFIVYLWTRAIFGTMGLWFVRHWLVLPTQFKFLKELCFYAIPLGFVCFFSSVMPLIERWILFNNLGTKELGFYAVAAKISMLLVLPIHAFQMAWGPFSLSLFKEEDSIVTFNWVLKIFTLGILSIILMLSIVSAPLVYFLASDKYVDAAGIVFPMLMTLGVESIAWITMVGIGFSKRSSFDLVSCVIYVTISFLASLVLIKIVGFNGAAWGSLLGTIVKALIGTRFAQKLYYLEWSLRGVFVLTTLVLVGGLVGQIVYVSGKGWLGILIYLLALILLWVPGFFNLFNSTERIVIRTSFGRILNTLQMRRTVT